jgi:Lon protease-like protein
LIYVHPKTAVDLWTQVYFSMSDQNLLPLFPLNTVLFPGQLLPLHIFEERYQLMIKHCLEGDGTFGVVLIREGNEVGEAATPYAVGTVARIRKVDQREEGKMDLLCLGEARFKIIELDEEQPYLVASYEIWPWRPLQPEEVEVRAAQLKGMLTRYIKLLAAVTRNPVNLDDLPVDPLLLADLAAIALQVPNREKQQMLSEPSLSEFIDTCTTLLKRENQALQTLSAIPMAYDRKPPSISPN